MFCTIAVILPSVAVTGLSLPMIAWPYLFVQVVVFSSVRPTTEMRWWLSYFFKIMEEDRDRGAEGIDPELLVALRVCCSSTFPSNMTVVLNLP